MFSRPTRRSVSSPTSRRVAITARTRPTLTAKDVWYSKKDFKAYIEESKALGVNIIPEIDTPAHSLALTKVRPDLRHGTSGRQNDHLDIAKQYDECFKFVRGIFDEYVKGGDAAVFAVRTRFTWAPTSTPRMETRTVNS